MPQAATSLALDIQALAQLGRWLALPGDARARLLADLASTDPPLHARVARLAAASGSASQGGDPGASQALAAPLLQAAHAVLAQGVQAGAVLAGWRLLRELGRGGMSVVWLAERANGSLKRQVAIKLPLAAHLSDSLSERFARERDELAQLTHPHIARLYDAGVAETGQPYIALEYVIGQPITQFADERHLGVRQRLQLFQQVLAAVDHAHRHLVVHRDLKPANILVDDEGQVKLLDFGIAKLLALPADAAALTQEASAVMTPRYAAPEQVAGGPITTGTDVHAAGVVLYELLTGLLPLGAADASMAGLAHAVLHAEPLPPSQAATDPALRRQLAGDIDTVLLKALRKNPAERYATVERFSEDLRRVLAHEPVLARRVSLLHRARLLVQRHRAGSGAVAVASLLLLGSAGTAVQQHRASIAQEARATTVRNFLIDMVSDAEPNETIPESEITARQMVDAAVARAKRELSDQPRLQGELLGELGRIYARLSQPEPAFLALQQAVALLQAHAPASDAALNKARAHWAAQFYGKDAQAADRLVQGVLADCGGPGIECAKARAYALRVATVLASSRGNGPLALTLARDSTAEMRRAFGATDLNVTDALETEAMVARNIGDIPAATTAIEQAWTLSQTQTLRATARLGLMRTRAMVAMDRGEYTSALQQLEALGPVRASKADQAYTQRVLATASLETGMARRGLSAADAAVQLAADGNDSYERMAALQTRARAYVQAGQVDAAMADLRLIADDIAAMGLGDTSVEALRMHRLKATAQLASGQMAEAMSALESMRAQLSGPSSGQAREAAAVLELLGCAHFEQGNPQAALAMHTAARARWANRLPDSHPWMLRNAAFEARATRQLAPGSASAASAGQAWERWQSSLPDQSIWRRPLLPPQTADLNKAGHSKALLAH